MSAPPQPTGSVGGLGEVPPLRGGHEPACVASWYEAKGRLGSNGSRAVSHEVPMLASDVQFVVVDFECTGSVEGYPDQPWQLGLAVVARGTVDPERRFSTLLQVGRRPFNPYAPGRHALVRELLGAAPRLAELWPVLSSWLLGCPLVAHHAATEQKFLGEAFPLHRFGPWVDTLELVRIAYPHQSTHRLEDVVPALGLEPRVAALCPGLAPHDAQYDAVACATVLEHLLALPHWQGVTVDDVVAARSGWTRGGRRGAHRCGFC